MEKKFWMVLRHDGRGTPSVRHESLEQATEEAQRLAVKERAKFYVLAAVDCYEAVPEVAQRVQFAECSTAV